MNKKLLISIKNLTKEFESVTPIKDVSVDIYEGDVISIIGPSGTGKSTFLRCINRLTKPTSGQIFIDGEDILNPKTNINKVRQKVGMVFQSFNLFSHKSVIENVMMGQIDLLKKSPQEAYDKALELLDTVGLKDKAYSYPDELSGGQKQRVAIARTLSMNPKIILFDEPTSALDPTLVDEVLLVMKNLARGGLTLIIVTHEMDFARYASNRIFFMNESTIYEDGTPEQIFENPLKEKTRQFINKLKICEIDYNEIMFNFYKAGELVSDFAKKNMISPALYYKICLIQEEICFGGILKREGVKASLSIEYSSKHKTSVINIVYSGDAFNLEKELDEIQYKLILGMTKNIEHSQKDEHNVLKITLS